MTVQQPDIKRALRSRGEQVLTCVDLAARADALAVYTMLVELGSPEPSKEEQILRYVTQFGQLTTKQIKALVYPGQPHEPQRRSIDRLLYYKLLALVDQPHKGGPRGGSQMRVFQLGKEGRKLPGAGRRGHSVTVNYHSLYIANVHIAIFQAQSEKKLKINHYATEPNTHTDELAGVLLKPDLLEDLTIRQPDDTGIRRSYWIEVDLGTERQRQVLDQVEAYKLAYEDRAKWQYGGFPRILFLTTTDERASEIRYWLKRAGDLPPHTEVGTIAELLTILQR